MTSTIRLEPPKHADPVVAPLADPGIARARIEIPGDLMTRMQAWVNAAHGEVSGFGTVDLTPGGAFVVRDLFLPAQRGDASVTTIDPAAYSRLLVDLVRNGNVNSPLRLWWHSHADAPVFWSHTDRRTIDEGFPQADWFLSLVVNRDGDRRAGLRLRKPRNLWLDRLPVRVHVPDPVAHAAAADVCRKVGILDVDP